MEENGYFKKALSDFVFDVASGDSIRHLADLGYTPKEIKEQLAFSVPMEKIESIVNERIRRKELEAAGKSEPRVEYVKEYNSFGKPSFRRVVIDDKKK